jgi:hypothetical protein
MVAINVILVQSCRSRLTLLPVPGGHLELSLDVNADTALEGVRTYFFQRWRAEVHCLSWLFPEDFSLRANEEQLPFLVVCVDATGDLSLELVRDTACTAAHSDRSNGINPLLATATNPFPSEPWSFPDWLPHISEWIRGHFPQVRRISQVRCCPNGAVLKIDSLQRRYYLKQQFEPLAYESGLLRILNRRIPGVAPVLLPVFPDINTHITEAISGVPIDEKSWGNVLRHAARIQIESADFVHELNRAAVPHHDVSAMAKNTATIMSNLVALQTRSPNALTATEVEKLNLLLHKTAADFEALCRCELPETLVHGDLNQSNAISSASGGTVFIDWALSRITHPFFTLAAAVFARYDRNQGPNLSYENLCNAYLEPWRDFQRNDHLKPALEAASRLFWIDSARAMALLCRLGHIRNLINLPRFLRAALRAYRLLP